VKQSPDQVFIPANARTFGHALPVVSLVWIVARLNSDCYVCIIGRKRHIKKEKQAMSGFSRKCFHKTASFLRNLWLLVDTLRVLSLEWERVCHSRVRGILHCAPLGLRPISLSRRGTALNPSNLLAASSPATHRWSTCRSRTVIQSYALRSRGYRPWPIRRSVFRQ